MFPRTRTNRIKHLVSRPEGKLTRATESVTSSVPSGVYFIAAVASMVAALVFQTRNRPHMSLFVGQWAPTLLLIGIYNKLVKVSGSD